ncbi:helix-turn-helix domain-containing protein [Niallia taxi]|nr:helix-turn-helix domain-containing protein [Niallia taxi]MDE5055357.1 helix-turn-helix domain-containing protein [Niallia taxi]
MHDKHYSKELTTKEAAELLNVKTTTIHKYVKEHKLTPSNEASWHIDNRKYFYEADILRLKKEIEKPGYTTGDIAKILNLHTVTVSQYVNKGLLKAEKHIYRGRELNFISKEEFELFSKEYYGKKRAEKKDFYDKDTGTAWFQTFTNENDDEGRILIEDHSPVLVTNSGLRIPISEIKSNGFKPRTEILDHGYISKKGYAKFMFLYEENINYPLYDFIEICYKHLGPKNIKLGIEESTLILEIKPYLFPDDLLKEEILELLKSNLEDGSIIPSRKGIFIDSDYELLTFAASSSIKRRVKQAADEQNITMEEFLAEIVINYFNEEE